MNLQQIRWPVVLLVLAISLGGLFGAGYLLKSQTVDQPLRTMLDKAVHVESHSVERFGDQHKITVRLKESADLKEAYADLDKEIRTVLKTVRYEIEVEDRPTPELEQAAKRFDLYVQEALVTGQFATMADRLEAEAQKVGATVEVGVDGQRVYVAVTKGDAYLYRVVERPVERPLALTEGGFGL
ncbi:MAG: hypothetical protein ACOY94_07555 [Bacillota bacterium]